MIVQKVSYNRLCVIKFINRKKYLCSIFIFLSAFIVNMITLHNMPLQIYYVAVVKSMSMNWHNFFFASFDPSAFIAADKPPVGFWLQVASVKLFGFSLWSLLFPEALAGSASIVILYYLVYRTFGFAAALIAALIMFFTPITFLTNHTNIIDSLLVFVILSATWCTTRAIDANNWRWLLLGAVCLGVGFNIKGLAVYIVLPTLLMTYLFGSQSPWRTKVYALSIFVVVTLVISLSWITAVDIIPASQRPYVGSTSTNSEWELTLLYNGFDRLVSPSTSTLIGSLGTKTLPGTDDSVDPGVLRLFMDPLGGQIGWFLALSLLGIPLLYKKFMKTASRSYQQALLLWGGWFLSASIFFSYSSFIHAYYLTVLVPALSALASIALIELWKEYILSDWYGYLLPVIILIETIVHIYIISSYPTFQAWLAPSIAFLGAGSSIILIAARTNKHNQLHSFFLKHKLTNKMMGRECQRLFLTIGLLNLSIAPILWDSTTMMKDPASLFFLAGPISTKLAALPPLELHSQYPLTIEDYYDTHSSLTQYLEEHQGHSQYLVATPDTDKAAIIILQTGKPVMAFGGYTGTDPILTQKSLTSLIRRGKVRYFLLPGSPMDKWSIQMRVNAVQNMFAFTGSNVILITWIVTHCNTVLIPQETYYTPTYDNFDNQNQQLYDCSNIR